MDRPPDEDDEDEDEWNAARVAPLFRWAWTRAQFPTAAERVARIASVLQVHRGSADPLEARALDAIDAGLRCATSDWEPEQRPFEQVRIVHAAVLAARVVRASPALDTIGLMLCVLRAWLGRHHESPLAVACRDLGWSRVPSPLAPLAAEITSLLWDTHGVTAELEEIEGDSLELLPEDHAARIPMLESLADRGVRVEYEVERACRRLRDTRASVNALVRGALRRFATNRTRAALAWIERASLQLLREPGGATDDIGTVVAYLQRECLAYCMLEQRPRLPPPDDVHQRASAAQEGLSRIVPDLIERFDAEDPALVRGALERWCEETLGAADGGWRPRPEIIATLAWAHSTLAELAELEADFDGWRRHKGMQLDVEDRFGLALAECSASSSADFGEHECGELVGETPPRAERELQCIEEAMSCREQGDERRQAFWLDRAAGYRAC